MWLPHEYVRSLRNGTSTPALEAHLHGLLDIPFHALRVRRRGGEAVITFFDRDGPNHNVRLVVDLFTNDARLEHIVHTIL